MNVFCCPSIINDRPQDLAGLETSHRSSQSPCETCQVSRSQYGHYYHLYNRGNTGENLFREERNYAYFLKWYTHHIFPITDTYAYCLMKNHFHFLIRVKDVAERGQATKKLQPSQAFSNFFNAYTKSMNKAYGRTGSLFEKPFERIEVASERYAMQLVVSIHINPQKHGFVPDFRLWPWSSYHALRGQQVTKLARESVIAWFGNQEQFDFAHQAIQGDCRMATVLSEQIR